MSKLAYLLLRARLAALSLLNPWRAVRQLRDENERLTRTLSDPLLTGIQIGNGSLDIGMEGAGPQLLAGMFLGMLEKHPEAANYIEMSFSSPQGPIVVTVVRPGGKTPHQLRREAEQKLAEALGTSTDDSDGTTVSRAFRLPSSHVRVLEEEARVMDLSIDGAAAQAIRLYQTVNVNARRDRRMVFVDAHGRRVEDGLGMRMPTCCPETPRQHVGDSAFESWYQQHPKAAAGGDKQLARDAYAAGMADPLATRVIEGAADA